MTLLYCLQWESLDGARILILYLTETENKNMEKQVRYSLLMDLKHTLEALFDIF